MTFEIWGFLQHFTFERYWTAGLHPLRSLVSSVLGHFGPMDRSDAATSVLCSVTSVLRCYSFAAAIQRRIVGLFQGKILW